MRYTYKELQDIVDLDIRSKGHREDAEWLREPENHAVWARELYRLSESVESQLEMAQNAVDGMPDGPAKDAEQVAVKEKSVGRLYYLKHVEKRIAEVEALHGHEPLVMLGQVRLILDAALAALDNGERSKAISFLERLQDAVEENEKAIV